MGLEPLLQYKEAQTDLDCYLLHTEGEFHSCSLVMKLQVIKKIKRVKTKAEHYCM